MKSRFVRTIVASAVLLAFASLAGMAYAQVKAGKTRPLATKHLMAGLVKPNCTDLKKALDAGPSDDEAWDKVTMHASLLNEASYILMDDGRCPDGVWAGAASKALREGSSSVLAAAKKKDVDAAKTAFGAMTKACGTCHKEHKG